MTPTDAVDPYVTERARVCKQLLGGENNHDGSLWLIDHGDESCIPALMRVLDTTKPDDPSLTVCTYGHAVDALEAISGATDERTYEEWVAWYEQRQ